MRNILAILERDFEELYSIIDDQELLLIFIFQIRMKNEKNETMMFTLIMNFEKLL